MNFEATLRANRRDWILSPDIWRARDIPRDGRAVIAPGEVALLKTALGNRHAPARMAATIHAVKTTIGGEVISCTLLDSMTVSQGR